MTDALYVAHHLRPEDQVDVAALRDDQDPTALAIYRYQSPGVHFSAIPDGTQRPVLVGGIESLHSGTAELWVLGTPDWKSQVMVLAHFTRDRLVPNAFAAGFHRVQAHVRKANTNAVRFLDELVGMNLEGTLEGYGRQGEDFLMYAINRGDQS